MSTFYCQNHQNTFWFQENFGFVFNFKQKIYLCLKIWPRCQRRQGWFKQQALIPWIQDALIERALDIEIPLFCSASAQKFYNIMTTSVFYDWTCFQCGPYLNTFTLLHGKENRKLKMRLEFSMLTFSEVRNLLFIIIVYLIFH